jgi:hypothetical protein
MIAEQTIAVQLGGYLRAQLVFQQGLVNGCLASPAA